LDKTSSTDKIAGYTFSIPNYQGGYKGFATFDGKSLAIYFSNMDTSSETAKNDYGVGIAQITRHGFKKVYYQPTYKGGNTGFEECEKVSTKS